MKHKIISKLLKLFAGIKSPAFSNIAEGTHAGSLTLTAAEDIDSPYLLVKIDDTGNAVEICTAADLPVGLALDECDMGEGVAVALPGCAESTFMCRAASDVDAGDEVFTAADGKVANTATGSCYKVGVAINAAQAGALVEVDPQGFGTRPNQIAESGICCKSGIMVGLGETPQEVEELMDDVRNAGCRILTIGQYLQPSHKHYPVAEYVTPAQFAIYKEMGLQKGFDQVESGPLVRSSYHADKSKILTKKT